MNTAVFHTVAARSTEVASLEVAIVGTRGPAIAVRDTDERWSTPEALRTALLAGSLAAVVITWVATSGLTQAAEPELVMLLRGMAALKGLLVVSAAGLVWWRLGQPVSSRVAVTYVACVWVLCASTVLIWKLAFVAAAAVLFHAGGFVGLCIALREGRGRNG